jgi:hypothetical protein
LPKKEVFIAARRRLRDDHGSPAKGIALSLRPDQGKQAAAALA